jgi:hypothetical protein
MILLLPDNGAATNHDYHFGGRYTNAKYSLLQWFPGASVWLIATESGFDTSPWATFQGDPLTVHKQAG